MSSKCSYIITGVIRYLFQSPRFKLQSRFTYTPGNKMNPNPEIQEFSLPDLICFPILSHELNWTHTFIPPLIEFQLDDITPWQADDTSNPFSFLNSLYPHGDLFALQEDRDYAEIQKEQEEIIYFNQSRYLMDSNSEQHYQYTLMAKESHYEQESPISSYEKENRHFFTPTKAHLALTLDLQQCSKKKTCTCKKTGCIKKYCECFKAGEVCGKHCECQNCKNCQQLKQLLLNTRSKTQTRKKSKVEEVRNSSEKWVLKCSCERSGCRNNYCACRAEGVGCSEHCQCSGCGNCEKEERGEGESGRMEEGEGVKIERCLRFESESE